MTIMGLEFDERWGSLSLLVIFQCFLGDLLWNTDGPLLRPVIAWLKRHPVMAANAVGNIIDGCKRMGVAATPEIWVMSNVGCGIHHFCGALLALLGHLLGNVWLFRLGLSFEIGEDVFHYGQMAYALVRPPGPAPFNYWPKSMWAMLALHHSLGFFAGTFAYLNLADWPEVQRLVFVLIAGPLPGIFGAPLQLFGDVTERSAVGMINVAVTIGGFLFLVYARFFVFIPLAFPLDARIAEEYGSLASGLVAVPLVLFGIFSLVSFIDNLWDIIAAVRVQTSARDRLRICRRLGARLVLHWPTPLHFDEGPYEQAPDNKVALSPAPADAAEKA